jgi:metal-responsive CopG/Arc/MetJ family transcriptional regulator
VKKIITVSIDEELLQELSRICQTYHYERSEAIREAIRHFIRFLRSQEEAIKSVSSISTGVRRLNFLPEEEGQYQH